MARPKKSNSRTLISLAVLAIVVLGGLLGYKSLSHPALNEKAAIQAGIDATKKMKSISPEQEQLLKLQLSILAYLTKNGAPPDSLNQLIPTYLDTVPLNASTKKPYYYKRNGRQYVLRASEDEALQVASLSPNPNGVAPKKEITNSEFINPNTIQLEDYTYDPTGKRDPFRPFDLSRKPPEDSSVTALERYDIGQLRLAAILDNAEGEKTAMVENEGGRGFTVKVGTKIGTNNGVVVSIERDKVKVLETTTDFAGNDTQNVVEMKLYTRPVLDDGSPLPEGTTYSGKRAPAPKVNRRSER